MASTTTNFGLRKIDLTDAPPDITVLNQNWDTIDEELDKAYTSDKKPTAQDIGAVPLDGSEAMTGQLQTPKVVFDRSGGTHGDCGIYKNNSTGDAPVQITDRGSNDKVAILSMSGQNQTLKFTVGEQDEAGNTQSSAVYDVYHQGNPPAAEDVGALPDAGGTVSGAINFKQVENGYGRVVKNHSSSADYGTNVTDFDAEGNSAKLTVSAKDNTAYFTGRNNVSNKLYGTHNLRAGTSDLTAGSSTLATGEIYLVYQ